jgi:hypothetical protein
LLIIVVVAGVVLFFVFNRHQPLVTGNINDLSEITIIKGRYSQEGEITKSLSTADAKILFEELKSTRTAVVKHPKHLESMQNDPLYTIEVYYENGKMDTIYSTEILVKLFRFIDTKGPDGDSGYILSNKNERILSLLEDCFQ